MGRRDGEDRVVRRSDETPFIHTADRMDGSLKVCASRASKRGEFVSKKQLILRSGDQIALRIHCEAGHRCIVAFQNQKRRRTPWIRIDSLGREKKDRGRDEGDRQERARSVERHVRDSDGVIQTETSLQHVAIAVERTVRGVYRSGRGGFAAITEQIIEREDRIHSRQNRIDAVLGGRFIGRRSWRKRRQMEAFYRAIQRDRDKFLVVLDAE